MHIKSTIIHKGILISLCLIVIFAFISVTYSWFNTSPFVFVEGTNVGTVGYNIEANWYDDDGILIEDPEYLSSYDDYYSRFISLENKGASSAYCFLYFEMDEASYINHDQSFSYELYEVKTLDSTGLKKIFKGSGDPTTVANSNTNDYYINTTATTFWQKTSGGWVDVTSAIDTISGSKPVAEGSKDDYYLYNSSNYPILYQYQSSEWVVKAYDYNATTLNLYLTEGINLGSEKIVSSGDMYDLGEILLDGDLNTGVDLTAPTSIYHNDGASVFWRFKYQIITSTATSPVDGETYALDIKPEIFISGDPISYSITPEREPIWEVSTLQNLEDAFNSTTGANNRHVVKLMDDLSYTGNLTMYNSFTLDLNGNDLTLTQDLSFQTNTVYNSTFIKVPSGSKLTCYNVNIVSTASASLYIDMADGGVIEATYALAITAPNLSLSILGNASSNQMIIGNNIYVNVNYETVDEQRLNPNKGLILSNLKTASASLIFTKVEGGNASRLYISENSVLGNISAEAAVDTSNVSLVQIVNLGDVGYIDLSNVVFGSGSHLIDVYFAGSSSIESSDKIKLPTKSTSSNTYIEVTSEVDIITSDITGLTSYIRVFNDVVSQVSTLNEFEVSGSLNFTSDNIARPYYWVRFDLATDIVVQVLEYGTIASYFSSVSYSDPADPTNQTFQGWLYDGTTTEFIRNQAVIADTVLEPYYVDDLYEIVYDLDSGVINSYSDKETMVNEFLDDYTAFYNEEVGASLSRVTLLIPEDVGYYDTTSMVGRMGNALATPNLFFKELDYRAKWIWMIEYIMSVRDTEKKDNTYFDQLLDGVLVDTDGISLVKYEIWAFLADREHTVYPISMDFSNYSNGYDYIFFASYPHRYSKATYVKGAAGYSLTLPEPEKRGIYDLFGHTYGYIFGGWYADSGYVTLLGDAGDTLTYVELEALRSGTTVTLYAKWTPGVAKIIKSDMTEIYYNSLSSALAASIAGETVELLMNTSIATGTISSDITLDLGIFYLEVTGTLTMSNGTLTGEKAFIKAGNSSAALIISDDPTVEITEGVAPYKVAGFAISAFVIDGVRVQGINYTANGSNEWVSSKHQVLFMYWADGDNTNNITSDLVLKMNSAQVVTDSTTVTPPSHPTMGSWTFVGWNLYSGGYLTSIPNGYMYFEGSSSMSAFKFSEIPIYSSMVFVALFSSPVRYSNDGITSHDSDTAYFGEQYTLLVENPKINKKGNRLVGWSYIISGTETFESYVPATIQYYLPYDPLISATWLANQYTVVFDSNTGSGLMVPTHQDFVYGFSETLIAMNGFTKAGYAFTGWNTVANGSGKSYSDKESISTSNAVTLANGITVVLYAQWTEDDFTIVFNSNGGDGLMSEQILTYGDIDSLTANSFTKLGYSFRGWSIASVGTYIDFYDGATLSNLQLVDLMDGGTSATLYAVWGEDLFIVSLSSDGVVTNYVKLVSSTIKPGLTKTGYTFGGWYLDSGFTQLGQSAMNITVTTDLMYYAKWTPITYTLKLRLNPGQFNYYSRNLLVDDFLADYMEFYNEHRNDDGGSRNAITTLTYLIDGNPGYDASTAFISRSGILNCGPSAFFNDTRVRAKWIWLIEYLMGVRSTEQSCFQDILDGNTSGSDPTVRSEIRAFLAQSSVPLKSYIPSDYTISANANGYTSLDLYKYREITISRTYDDGKAIMTVAYPDKDNTWAQFHSWVTVPTATADGFPNGYAGNLTTTNNDTVILYPVSYNVKRYGTGGKDGDETVYDASTGIVYGFINDYRLFYNTKYSAIATMNLEHPGDASYDGTVAYCVKNSTPLAYPSLFFNDATYGQKWVWLLNYNLAVRGSSGASYFENILNGGTNTVANDAGVRWETLAFLRGVNDPNNQATGDYSGRVARYSYWLFMPLDV